MILSRRDRMTGLNGRSPVAMVLLLALAACANESTDFSEGRRRTEPSPQQDNAEPAVAAEEPQVDPTPDPEPVKVEGKALRFSADGGEGMAEVRTETSVERRPVSIYFVLDTTGSMSAELATVRTNVVGLAQKLTKEGLEAKMGLITFDDGVQLRVPLGSPVDDLVRSLNSINAGGGGDSAEASLAAIQEAARRLPTEDTRVDSTLVIILVTDVRGHYGDSPENNRDCSTGRLVNDINALPTKQRERLKIFYSVRESLTSNDGCRMESTPPPANARGQFDLVLRGIDSPVPVEKRGGALTFPFSETTIMTEFVSALQKVVPGELLRCLSSSAILKTKDSQEILARWQADDMKSIFESAAEGKPVVIDISAEALDGRSPDQLELELKRCCVGAEAARAGDLKCVKEDQGVGKFEIIPAGS